MKVGLVHDWLNQMGGAEKVLLQLSGMYPDALVQTSLYSADLVDPEFRNLNVSTSF